MRDLTKQIEEIILRALPNAQVMVQDPMNDGAHLEATVISDSFVGMSLIDQHRQVMQPLKEAFAGNLHALALKTYTPEKWASAQG
ncbi:MAG: BolA/IbaG family iron-sulfur metabolism protein [Mariniblastus sp.]|jgi:acid stress-induced BolA-like protein IbaG/YrbA|nr:BolA/IbaG family iron-sulfur metabolism protein [Mariniblastus sp.]|tara:strand:+ start:5220 stop:5474 length:255 start_codon:yes stop_codon:yes gene_type:complete